MSNQTLPSFKYHPDPRATGAIVESDTTCPCCGLARGFEYRASFYSQEEVDGLCPWCIADGSAAEKYDGCYSDDEPLLEMNIDSGIVDEVCRRTPGFSSWQQEVWQSCCGDGCAFLGDVPADELRALSYEDFAEKNHGFDLPREYFVTFQHNYEPKGDPSVYKWRCLHCGKITYYTDGT